MLVHLKLPRTSGELILPVTVLPEICYLLQSRLGHNVMRRFVRQLAANDVLLELFRKPICHG